MSKGTYRDAARRDLYDDYNGMIINEDEFIAGCVELEDCPSKEHVTRPFDRSKLLAALATAKQRAESCCPYCHKPL